MVQFLWSSVHLEATEMSESGPYPLIKVLDGYSASHMDRRLGWTGRTSKVCSTDSDFIT